MIDKAIRHIAGGAAAGGFMGGIGGLATGEEGGVGKGIFGGALVGAVAGGGVSSLTTRGGILNNAAISLGGIADDLMGNTGSAAYFRAVESNRGLNATREGIVNNLQGVRNQRRAGEELATEKVTSNALSDQAKRDTLIHLRDNKNMNVGNIDDVSDSDLLKFVTSKQAGYTEDVLNEPFHGPMKQFISEMEQGQAAAKQTYADSDIGKGVSAQIQKYESELSDFGTKNNATMDANQKLIDAGPGSGSVGDFFEGLGDVNIAANKQFEEYRGLNKKFKAGDMEDADYARMMNMEAEFGSELSASIRSGTELNSQVAGYSQHISNMRNNVSATNRALTYGGAGLTGVMVGASMGRRKNHKRGLNSKRGVRF